MGIFPGSLGNYGGVHKGIPVVTIELPHSTRAPLEPETRQMWLDLLHWMNKRIDANHGQEAELDPAVNGVGNVKNVKTVKGVKAAPPLS